MNKRRPVTTQRIILRIIAAVGIILLAGGLRLWNLENQSVWLDEFASVAHLDAPAYRGNLYGMQINCPTHTMGPLHYYLQYHAARLFSLDVYGLRVLNVALGLLCVLAVFEAGRWLCGWSCGLLAALCVALSPQHIWFSQEPRPYTLLTLLAVLSAYFLMRAVQEGGRWWWAGNVTANVLVAWTHLFGPVLFVTEGIYLLALRGRVRFRTVLSWAIVINVALLPWYAWLLSTPFLYSETGASGVRDMARQVIPEIFADEAVALNPEIMPPWQAHPDYVAPRWLGRLLLLRPFCDAALLALLLGSAAVALCRSLAVSNAPPGAINGNRSDDFPRILLPLLLFLLPGTILGVLALLSQRATIGTMYSLYATVGLYLMLGMAWGRGRVRFRSLPWAGAALLLLLYGYQLAITLPFTTRTDWQGATRRILDAGEADDAVLAMENIYWSEHARFYLGWRAPRVRILRTFQAVCDDAARYFEEQFAAKGEGARRNSAWVLVNVGEHLALDPNCEPAERIAEGLAARGMSIDFEWFYGHYNLALGRARAMPDARPHLSPSEVPFCLSPDYSIVAADLGLAAPGDTVDTETLMALRRIIYHWPPIYDYSGAVSAFDFLGEGRPDLAERMALYVLASSPNLTMAHLALGLALLAQGRDGEAQRIFRELWPRHRGLQYLHEALLDALLQGDCDAVAEQYERLRAHGHIYWIGAIDYLCHRRCGI